MKSGFKSLSSEERKYFLSIPDVVIMGSLSWKCPKCNLTNSPLNKRCADSKCKYPAPLELYKRGIDKLTHEISRVKANAISTLVANELKGFPNMTDQKQLEKHAKFYNEEAMTIKDMTYEQLEEREAVLSDIIFEAKSRLTGVVNAKKDKLRLMTDQQRESLLNPDWIASNSRLITDSTQAVKVRKDRMNQAQKVAESMRAMGLSESAIKEAFGEMYKATRPNGKSNETVASFNDKPAQLLGSSSPNSSEPTQNQQTDKSSTQVEESRQAFKSPFEK